MEKMIKVINDNLRSVVNGIKEHKVDLESNLEDLKSEMSLKVKEANTYKTEVESARSIVSSLEGEISELEQDLADLNAKFGAKNFKEILSAGNKEINAKIIEKRSLIGEQSQIMLDLTEKARNLKDVLIDLRQKKSVVEENLDKALILEGYFETRINEIIRFSEESPSELANYREEIPQDELISQVDVDVDSIIDGSIFEEIDELSTSEVDDSILQSVLANPNDITIYEEENDEESSGDAEAQEVSATIQLENMISEAKSFVESKQKIDVTDDLEAEKKLEEEILTGNLQEETLSETPLNDSDDLEENDERDAEQGEEQYIDIYVDEKSDKESITDYAKYDSSFTINDIVEDPFIDIKGLEAELSLNDDEGEDSESDAIELEIDGDDLEPINIDDELKEIKIDEDINGVKKEIENISSNESLEDAMKELGLEVTMFDKTDLILLEASFDKANMASYIEVLKKHHIPVDNIYKNARALANVKADDMDNLLGLLEQTDATTHDIILAYKYLDRVNISKLEQVVMSGVELSLTECLAETMPYDGSDEISSVLGLSRKAADVLKKTATEDEYRIMNVLPELVLENYREIRGLGINNLEECISKYPHRFTLTPSKFHEIMDKYDTEDLIRCINKNAAVIDKL